MLDSDPASVASKNNKINLFSHFSSFYSPDRQLFKNMLLLHMFSNLSQSIFYFSLLRRNNRNLKKKLLGETFCCYNQVFYFKKINRHLNVTHALKNLPHSPSVFRSLSSVFFIYFLGFYFRRESERFAGS
jgi:hypothetical protein